MSPDQIVRAALIEVIGVRVPTISAGLLEPAIRGE